MPWVETTSSRRRQIEIKKAFASTLFCMRAHRLLMLSSKSSFLQADVWRLCFYRADNNGAIPIRLSCARLHQLRWMWCLWRRTRRRTEAAFEKEFKERRAFRQTRGQLNLCRSSGAMKENKIYYVWWIWSHFFLFFFFFFNLSQVWLSLAFRAGILTPLFQPGEPTMFIQLLCEEDDWDKMSSTFCLIVMLWTQPSLYNWK